MWVKILKCTFVFRFIHIQIFQGIAKKNFYCRGKGDSIAALSCTWVRNRQGKSDVIDEWWWFDISQRQKHIWITHLL